MKVNSLRAVLRSLNDVHVRYMIVGGVAVNIHGYQRLTQDLDLVIGLDDKNICNAIAAFERLAYRPIIPVALHDFANTVRRRDWVQNRNMEVFSLVSEQYPDTTVDVFVNEPFDFMAEYSAAQSVALDHGLEVKVVSIPTLIEMKRRAGRDKDRDDIQHLTWIVEEKGG